jgi:aminoglycoside 6'-N-acetyltransferase I
LIVREATASEYPIWAAMLARLHEWGDEAQFIAEIPSWLELDEPMVCFLAFTDAGEPIGMVDARVRNYAEGAPNLRAGYVEDIWVEAGHRRSGVASALLGAVEQWASAQGLNWLGSDTELPNELSEAWHRAAGFEVVERLVVFGKPLA